MPARDALHETVKTALIKDGWKITHDPYSLQFGDRDLYADLGAERTLAAEKENERIAVEVKSFLGPSDMRDLERGLGQFVIYKLMLSKADPERKLFLAMPERAYRTLLGHVDGQNLIDDVGLSLLTVDPATEEIVRWLQ